MHAKPGADTKSGGGGVLSVLGPIQKRGGAVRFRYDPKAGRGGGGGGLLSVLGPIRKAGGRGGGAACRTMI